MLQSLKRYRWLILGVLVLCATVLAVALATRSSPRPSVQTAAGETDRAGRLAAYEGLGSWVDLWDARAWNDPAGTVEDMASHGVRTLYIQTGTAKSANGIANPEKLAEFITEAHRRDMFVVAWYLPNLKTGSVDFDRCVQAIEFRTEDGQRVDSFALDIESTAVKPVSLRNENLAALSKSLRRYVGPDYPLGGITPPPTGIRKQTGFWDVFPWRQVASDYDVIVPMAYYTFSTHTSKKVAEYAAENMRLLRSQPGCATIPVHMIGGIAGKSTASEVREFTRASRQGGAIGVSQYDWAGMSNARWRAQSAGWELGTP